MRDFRNILKKISDLKAKVLKDSISPHYLGSILEEMLGYTWWTDSPGNFELESLKLNSSLQVPELVIDRVTALDADWLVTESDIITDVTDNGDGTYTLSLMERYPGYMTAQIEHNILKGYYQNIVPGLEPDGDGSFEKEDADVHNCWMNVISVDSASNQIVVSLYPDSDTPAGTNFLPVAGMKFARWGNSGDSDDPRYAKRQNVIQLSSYDGRITKWFHVTKPIIDDTHIAAVFGTLPEFLADLDPRIKPGDDGVMADTVVCRRLITLDSIGRPVVTVIDRGPWKLGERYYDGSEPNDNGVYERSLVYCHGHGWLCNSGGIADADNIPDWKTTYWTHSIGDTRILLDFREIDSVVDIDSPECQLSLEAWYMGEDVTDSPAIYYDWTRQSVRNGSPDTASDTLWNEAHKNAGSSLVLDASDLNFQFGAAPEKLTITVTATLHDPNNPNLQPQAAQYFMI